jgi:fructokinase
MLYGGIEAGGTKFVCAVGDDQGHILAEQHFPTTTPEETLSHVISFFQRTREEQGVKLRAIGIASFGPAEVHPEAENYGEIGATPKKGWSGVNLVHYVKQALHLPVVFDTDVNGAMWGEARWGAARGLKTALYITVGTGIGGGAMVEGHLLHGIRHPEMGHLIIPHDRLRDPFAGICPFHGDCLEGLASGRALALRWGRPAEDLPSEHPAWSLEAHYLGLALTAYILTLAPQRIVMGGGVMKQPILRPLIRTEVARLLGDYYPLPPLERYIVPPALGDRAGVLGAIALAMDAHG